MMNRLPNVELNAEIRKFIYSRAPAGVNSSPINPEAEAAPAIVNNYGIIDQHVNMVVNNPPAQQAKTADNNGEKKDEKGLTSGQVLAAAGAFTATGVGLAYVWKNVFELNAMRQLDADCEAYVKVLSEMQFGEGPKPALYQRQHAAVARTRILLRLLIDYETADRRNTLALVALVGTAAVGRALNSQFFISYPGLAVIGSSCIVTIAMAANYIDFSCLTRPGCDGMIRDILEDLAAVDHEIAQASVNYPDL